MHAWVHYGNAEILSAECVFSEVDIAIIALYVCVFDSFSIIIFNSVYVSAFTYYV